MTDDPDVPSPTESLQPGVAVALSPLVRRIVADNPGLMTGPGTNTYLVGIDEIAVIDPGPEDKAHLDAIVGCGGDRIRWILPTHTHADHSPGVVGLKKRTGAEVLAIEEVDDLPVDEKIRDNFRLEATEFRLRAVHTPGHASNHTCWYLEEERLLFSGDHLMQGSTVVIAPPDGNMTTYLESLEKVRKLRLRAIAPGHGLVMDDPRAVIDEYLDHRRQREQQVLELVGASKSVTIDDLVREIYEGDVPDELLPVAAKTTWAHLLKLREEKKVTGKSFEGRWRVR